MKLKRIPRFKTEEEEREFWATHDSVDYFDYESGRRVVFPNLKPSLTTISLRLPKHLLAELKALANKSDVPYQSLIKVFLAERVQRELQGLVAKEGKVDYSVAYTRRGRPRKAKPAGRARAGTKRSGG